MQDAGLDEVDACQAGGDPFEIETAQVDDIGRGDIDNDPVGPRHQHAGGDLPRRRW